jgi:hypothetical protein
VLGRLAQGAPRPQGDDCIRDRDAPERREQDPERTRPIGLPHDAYHHAEIELTNAGRDEPALSFLVFVTAVCTMSNRIVQGFGLMTPSPARLHEAVERLHRQGYAGTVQYIRAQAAHASARRDRGA